MNPEIKQKWIDALRSGKYSQAHGFLRNDKKFCCLGVLADVVGCKWNSAPELNFSASLVIGQYPTYLDSPACRVRRDGKPENYLSANFLSVTEITDQQQSDLAKMNDVGQSFDEIADYIEHNL